MRHEMKYFMSNDLPMYFKVNMYAFISSYEYIINVKQRVLRRKTSGYASNRIGRRAELSFCVLTRKVLGFVDIFWFVS